MTSNTADQSIQAHYGTSSLLERITAALENAGADPDRPKCEDLFRIDQLHGRGLEATKDHAQRAGLRAGMHVLDLGCGVGGSSRYLASVCGCRVTAVDLTPEFVEVARELSRRCGLAERIEFRQANALALPFEEGSFDHVWSHNVTMNIEDKQGLAREVARVLKRGARFSCAEVAQGPNQAALDFPLPWASNPSFSFVVTPAEMVAALESAGLCVVEQVDLTEANIAYAKVNVEKAKRGEPPLQDNRVVMGDDFAPRVRNSSKAALEGKLVEQLIIAEKP
jgi:MPBQ/MSBQ methyltransferase